VSELFIQSQEKAGKNFSIKASVQLLKVFSQVFFKKLVRCGRIAHDLDLLLGGRPKVFQMSISIITIREYM